MQNGPFHKNLYYIIEFLIIDTLITTFTAGKGGALILKRVWRSQKCNICVWNVAEQKQKAAWNGNTLENYT